MRIRTPEGRSKALENLANTVFGNAKFDSVKTGIGIVTVKWIIETPMIFKGSVAQAHGRIGTFVPGFGCTISDAVQASCSAYPFFKRKTVTTMAGDHVELVDGGYCANNPTLYAIAVAVIALKKAHADLRVVSVGVGVYPEPKPRNLKMWLAKKYILSVQLLQKTLEINTQSMDQLRVILFKDIPTVRISDTFERPEMATDLLEHDLAKLNILRQRGRDPSRKPGGYARYAGTIYKGQGKTLDQAYLLHTHHWRDASSYVALTRSRGATELFVAEAGAPDIPTLARQMQRQQHRGSTLRFEAEPREPERKLAVEVQPDYSVGKGQREQVGPAHQKQPEATPAATRQEDPLALIQAAEMAHLRRVQKEAARREDVSRNQLFEREQAQARTAIERRHQKEDVGIAAARAKEDRDRSKRGFMTMAMEAISKRRAQARQMAEARLQRERRQQDRERAEQRKREIVQAAKALTDEQRRRDATVRKERDRQFRQERAVQAGTGSSGRNGQFRQERAELAARQLGVAPRDLKRQQELGKDRGIERDDDDRGL
jgi:hypothetical protein